MTTTITLEAAAELLGITPAELELSWQRGLEPGKLAISAGGALWFDQSQLEGWKLRTFDSDPDLEAPPDELERATGALAAAGLIDPDDPGTLDELEGC